MLAPASDRFLLAARRSAASPAHATAAVDRWDRQTETDTRPFHRPCYAGSVNNSQKLIDSISKQGTTTTPVLWPLFHDNLVSRYHKGKTSLEFNEARNDGVLGCGGISWTRMQTICTSLQTDNHASTPSLNFYNPDAVPDAQPTVSKHRRQILLSAVITRISF